MYHINAKTGNPNLCRSKTCTLEHFETKEEAAKFGTKKESVAEKASDAVEAVKEELAKDKAVEDAKQDGIIAVNSSAKGGTGKSDLAPKLAKHIAEELSTPEAPVVVIEEDLPATPEGLTLTSGPVGRSKSVTMHEVVNNAKPEKPAKTKKLSKKQQVKALVRDIIVQLDELAKIAPKHPLVAKTKKTIKKFRR